MRTYSLQVGKLSEAVKLYSEIGYPILERSGLAKKLVGYIDRGRYHPGVFHVDHRA